MENVNKIEEEKEELVDALEWLTDQFQRVLSGKQAGSVVESLLYAKSLLDKYER